MFQRLEDVEKRYVELTEKISDPEIISAQNEWKNFMKEHAEIEPIVMKYREYKNTKRNNNTLKRKIYKAEKIRCYQDYLVGFQRIWQLIWVRQIPWFMLKERELF